MSVHLREQEIPYETTTTHPRVLHGSSRPDHPDPGRFRPCREGPREPSPGTKRAEHPGSAHSVRPPGRYPSPALDLCRIREVPPQQQNTLWNEITEIRIRLFIQGHDFCHGMADADAAPVHASSLNQTILPVRLRITLIDRHMDIHPVSGNLLRFFRRASGCRTFSRQPVKILLKVISIAREISPMVIQI